MTDVTQADPVTTFAQQQAQVAESEEVSETASTAPSQPLVDVGFGEPWLYEAQPEGGK